MPRLSQPMPPGQGSSVYTSRWPCLSDATLLSQTTILQTHLRQNADGVRSSQHRVLCPGICCIYPIRQSPLPPMTTQTQGARSSRQRPTRKIWSWTKRWTNLIKGATSSPKGGCGGETMRVLIWRDLPNGPETRAGRTRRAKLKLAKLTEVRLWRFLHCTGCVDGGRRIYR